VRPSVRVNAMDICAWLRGLGLERYEQAFRDNAIDEATLPKLTAEDLRDIGVTAIGHRRILLHAIAALRAAAFRDTTEHSLEPDRSGGKAPEAQRRQLTVMFVDLIGSTALSARLDPEELRDIIGAYHRRCAEVITSSGGFVAKYLGAYFGYPQAHEEDAEQAARAGLALLEAVAKLDAGQATSSQVRVGIATGLVVVGDLLVRAPPRNKRSLVGPLIWRHGFRGLPNRTRLSSQTTRAACLAACLIIAISAHCRSRELTIRCMSGGSWARAWSAIGSRPWAMAASLPSSARWANPGTVPVAAWRARAASVRRQLPCLFSLIVPVGRIRGVVVIADMSEMR
jgi:hypothetical protein